MGVNMTITWTTPTPCPAAFHFKITVLTQNDIDMFSMFYWEETWIMASSNHCFVFYLQLYYTMFHIMLGPKVSNPDTVRSHVSHSNDS